jgi:hypothetical protein
MKKKDNILLFFTICLCTRSALVFFIKSQKENNLPIFGYMGLIPVFGFLYNYFFHNKNKKGFFGGKVWWNNLRIIHSLLYLLFSIFSINKNKYSWVPLLIDVIIGLISFVIEKT